MKNDTQELARIMDEILATALPEFFESGVVRIFVTEYPANSLVAAAFRNYRKKMLEGE